MTALSKPFSLQQIRNRNHPALPALQSLYETAFPAVERREFSHLLMLLPQQDMHLFIIACAKDVAGLCIFWRLKSFYFLEHFAVAPAYQGQGLGRQVMQWLLARTNRKLILEVERPVDVYSRRRIRFYSERLGFTLHDTFEYQQPPYQQRGQPVPLYLMSAEPIPDTLELERIASHLKQQVYERFYY